MSWYGKEGSMSDVVLSSRVRLARNVEGLPMGDMLADERAAELIKGAGEALAGYDRIDFDRLDPVTAAAYAEEHLVSTEFAAAKSPRALFTNESADTYIMVCEEDHFRIQSITRGYSLNDAYAHAAAAESALSDKFKLAFDPELGYLTHCPTNLGTAMRASLMMFLPALTESGQIASLARQLSKLGMTVRGMYGEGSDAAACLYQISNQVTLGITEEETISKLTRLVDTIINEELRRRRELLGKSADEAADICSRSFGILTHSRLMSCREFMDNWVNVRLGVSLSQLSDGKVDFGIPSTVTYKTLDTALIESQPAVLTLLSGGGELSPRERDLRRSALLRERLGEAG